MVFSEADDFEPVDRQAPRQGKILPFPPRRVPDWLVGPADGLGAAADPEDSTSDEASPDTLPQPVLGRPGFAEPSPASEPLTGDEPGEAEARAAETTEAEIAAGPARPRRTAPSGPWAPVASSVPVLKLAPPTEPEPVEEEPAAVSPARPRGLPGRDEDRPRAVVPPPLAPLQEPWWVIVLDTLRSSRPAQLSVAGVLLAAVLGGYWMWPRGAGTTSLSDVRRYPSQFDGRGVTVRGRVGDDVFAVGAGWAFYLMQGRDTIVTFTRIQAPRPHEVLTVKGQVSTGFLDGVPRQALFEDTGKEQ
jgi:hypothetical protein